MSGQSEALRLADALEISSNHGIRREAAAELRRIHVENEAMRNVARRGGHIATAMSEIDRLTAQRDALLEALKAAEPYLRHADVAYNVYVQARAAIAKAENKQ